MSVNLDGSPDHVRSQLVQFKRAELQLFGLGENDNFDMVVSDSEDALKAPSPVGLISKTYSLIQHRAVFDRAIDFVSQATNRPVENVRVSTTSHGERFWMRVNFGEGFRIAPDGSDVGLQLLCRNAVDGSSAVRAELGWFRFACSNGMLVGLKLGKVRLAHKEGADLGQVFESLDRQMAEADEDRTKMAEWVNVKIQPEVIQRWADMIVQPTWGALSACRVWHICTSGQDVSFTPPFRKENPTQKTVKWLGQVPGSPERAENLYAVAQALSWVSSHRTDRMEAESMTRQIPKLLEALYN